MSEDESLRSKYTRLGVEFKKLRERLFVTKETLKSQVEKVASLEAKCLGQEIHVRNLENEKESLIFRNQCLVKQTDFLRIEIENAAHRQHRSKPNDSHSNVETNFRDEVLNKALKECGRLNEELVSQSNQFLAKIELLESTICSRSKARPSVSVSVQTPCFPLISPFTQSTSSVDAISSPDALCLRDHECGSSISHNGQSSSLSSRAFTPERSVGVHAPGGYSDVEDTIPTPSAVVSPLHRDQSFPVVGDLRSSSSFSSQPLGPKAEELTTREKVLLSRISHLEKQVAEVVLQQRIESRRHQLSQQPVLTPPLIQASDEEEETTPQTHPATGSRENLLTQYYDEQIRQRNEQLTVHTGRLADAYEEIRCLHEHLRVALAAIEASRRRTSSVEAKASTLEEELDSTKMRTAQQLSDMAIHLATLTDDIHVLRGGGCNTDAAVANGATHNPSRNTSAHEKMNSFFGSLLR